MVGGGKPPAWALFDLWAAGFLLLGEIWSNVLTRGGAAAGHVRIDMGALRSIPGAVLAWTVFWSVLFVVWALDPDPDPSAIVEGPGSVPLPRMKPSDAAMFEIWVIGLVLLGAVWVVARFWSARHRRPLPRASSAIR